MQKRFQLQWILAALLVFVGAGPAAAVTIDADVIDTVGGDGETSAVIPGVATVSASGGVLDVRGDESDFAVAGGFQTDELDASGDTITIVFDQAVVIEELVIGRLFEPGVRDDLDFEMANIQADTDDGTCSGGCVASADGSWNGSGSFSSTGPDGEWTIANPFGTDDTDAAVTELLLSAELFDAVVGSQNSDFSIVSIEFRTVALPNVPEPASAALLALGLAALGLRRRR